MIQSGTEERIQLPQPAWSVKGKIRYVGTAHNFLLLMCFHVKTPRNNHTIFGNGKKFSGKALPWLLLLQCWPCLGGNFIFLEFADSKWTWPNICNMSYTTQGALAQQSVTELMCSWVTLLMGNSEVYQVFLEGAVRRAAGLWTLLQLRECALFFNKKVWLQTLLLS